MSLHLEPDQGSYVAPSFAHATVRDAMRTGVVSLPPDAPAIDVARLMALRHIHAVIVAGLHREAGRAESLRWGVASDVDLLCAAADGRVEDLTAGDLAVAAPVTVTPATSLPEAARAMADAGVTHLVVEEAGEPVGVLSTLDLAGVVAWGRA